MDLNHQPLLLWAHTLDEYKSMFDLPVDIAQKRVVEFGFGPGSLNAELTQQGAKHVVSCHAIYRYPLDSILSFADDGLVRLEKELKAREHEWVWKYFKSIDQVLETREKAMALWQADLKAGLHDQRYRYTPVFNTGFADYSFDHLICPNPHFGHQKLSDYPQDFLIIKEFCRIAHDVRIFPLLTAEHKLSPLMTRLMADLHYQGYGVEIRQVNYEFQKGGNAMMRVWANTCELPE